MKVTARDIAALVRETQMEVMRKRSAEPKESIIDALINDEVAKLTSLVGDEEQAEDGENGNARQAAGSQSLDPGSFINTQGWVSDFGIDVPSGAIPRPDAAAIARGQQPAKQSAKKQTAQPQRRTAPTRPPPGRPDDDVDLSQMLEPDKTGMHGPASGGRGLMILLVLLLVAGAGVLAGLFLLHKI
jgi:hypothetical protein